MMTNNSMPEQKDDFRSRAYSTERRKRHDEIFGTKIMEFEFHCCVSACSRPFITETFIKMVDSKVVDITYYKGTKQKLYFGVWGLPYCQVCYKKLIVSNL